MLENVSFLFQGKRCLVEMKDLKYTVILSISHVVFFVLVTTILIITYSLIGWKVWKQKLELERKREQTISHDIRSSVMSGAGSPMASPALRPKKLSQVAPNGVTPETAAQKLPQVTVNGTAPETRDKKLSDVASEGGSPTESPTMHAKTLSPLATSNEVLQTRAKKLSDEGSPTESPQMRAKNLFHLTPNWPNGESPPAPESPVSRFKKLSRVMSIGESPPGSPGTRAKFSHRALELIHLTKTTGTLFIVTLAYIVSAIPHHVLSMLFFAIPNFDCTLSLLGGQFYYTFIWSYMINSAINPFIYGFRDRRFRREMRALYDRLPNVLNFFKKAKAGQ